VINKKMHIFFFIGLIKLELVKRRRNGLSHTHTHTLSLSLSLSLFFLAFNLSKQEIFFFLAFNSSKQERERKRPISVNEQPSTPTSESCRMDGRWMGNSFLIEFW